MLACQLSKYSATSATINLSLLALYKRKLYRSTSYVIRQVNYTTVGYECTPFADISRDANFVETAISNGVRTFITSGSSNDDSTVGYEKIHELLSDLTITDDNFHLKDCFIGHRLTSDENDWGDSIKNLYKYGKSLNFITIQPPSTPTDNFNHRIDRVEEIVQQYSNAKHKNKSISSSAANSNDSDRSDGPVIGVDITTEYIMQSNENDIINIIRNSSNRIGIVTVATNCFTKRAAFNIIKAAKDRQIITVSTDVLRSHPKKPAYFSMYSGHSLGSGAFVGNMKSDKDINSLIQTSLDDFKKNLGRCVHLEKEYMSKLHNVKNDADGQDFVPLTDICWAHVLSSTLNNGSIDFPEEFHYLLQKQVRLSLIPFFLITHTLYSYTYHREIILYLQINVKLEVTVDVLNKKSKEHSEWLSVYQPLVKMLFASYLRFYQAKKTMMLHDISKIIGASSVNDLPTSIGTLSINLGSDYTLLSCAVIDSIDSTKSMGTENTIEMYDKIETIAAAFTTR